MPRLPPPVHKTKVPLAMASSLFRVHELPSARSQGGGPSGGSPERGKLVTSNNEGQSRVWSWCLEPEALLDSGRWAKGWGQGLGRWP